MLAGLDLIGKMPAGEPRFMVVFTDGEDLNSSYKREDVLRRHRGWKVSMPMRSITCRGREPTSSLPDLPAENRGQIWKAETGSNLVEIFQSVASKMQYYYVVSYLFPTTGKLAVTPAALTFDEIRTSDPRFLPPKGQRLREAQPPVAETALVAGIALGADAAAGDGFALQHRPLEGFRQQRQGSSGRTGRGRRSGG